MKRSDPASQTTVTDFSQILQGDSISIVRVSDPFFIKQFNTPT
jgi:hypothetical protein